MAVRDVVVLEDTASQPDAQLGANGPGRLALCQSWQINLVEAPCLRPPPSPLPMAECAVRCGRTGSWGGTGYNVLISPSMTTNGLPTGKPSLKTKCTVLADSSTSTRE